MEIKPENDSLDLLLLNCQQHSIVYILTKLQLKA